MDKSLPWIILGIVLVGGIIAYIVISNKPSTSSTTSNQQASNNLGGLLGGTPSQWIVDLGALATIYQHLYDAGVITK
jgi:hypothetical protein